MEKLSIIVQLVPSDTVEDIRNLLPDVINKINDKGFSVLGVVADGIEVFNEKGFVGEFKQCKKEIKIKDVEENKYTVQVYGYVDATCSFGRNYYKSEMTLDEYNKINKQWYSIAILVIPDISNTLPTTFRNKKEGMKFAVKQEFKLLNKKLN